MTTKAMNSELYKDKLRHDGYDLGQNIVLPLATALVGFQGKTHCIRVRTGIDERADPVDPRPAR